MYFFLLQKSVVNNVLPTTPLEINSIKKLKHEPSPYLDRLSLQQQPIPPPYEPKK